MLRQPLNSEILQYIWSIICHATISLNCRAAWQRLAAVNQTDKNSATPACIAAQYGHTVVVISLVAAGCHVNQARTDGWTPVYIAAYQGHLVPERGT